MKTKNAYQWLSEHERAFLDLKQQLSSPPTLQNFDPARDTELDTDASRINGLGFILRQKHGDEWKVITCGSRFITDTERRYSMVELELLGVVWALHKCRVYLQGMKNFKVITDHRPLESILNKKLLSEIESPRLQRLKEKTLPFGNFRTIWRSGKKHVLADALSRAPVEKPTSEDLIIDD